MAEVAITFVVGGPAEAIAAFQRVSAEAKQLSATTTDLSRRTDAQTQAFRGARTAVVNVGQAIAGAAAVASILARNNKELQRDLEVLSLTMSGVSTSLRAVGAAMRLVVNIIGVKIAAVMALVAAVVFLIRHWEQAKEVAFRVFTAIKDFFMRVFEGIAMVFRGLGTIIVGVFKRDWNQVRIGVGQMQEGFVQLGDVVADLGEGVKRLALAGWDKLKEWFGSTKEDANNLREQLEQLDDELRHEMALREITQNMQGLDDAMKDVIFDARDARRVFDEFAESLRTNLSQALTDIDKLADQLGGELEDTFTRQMRVAARAGADAAFVIKEAWRQAVMGVHGTMDRLQQIINQTFRVVTKGAVESWLSGMRSIETSAQRMATSLQMNLGAALAGLLSGTASFGDIWIAIWRAIVDEIVAQLLRIAAIQKIIQGVSGFFGGIIDAIAKIFGFQHGGQFIAQRPTPIMVHAGEQVNVRPMTGAHGGGGGVTVNFQGPMFVDEVTWARMMRQIKRGLR